MISTAVLLTITLICFAYAWGLTTWRLKRYPADGVPPGGKPNVVPFVKRKRLIIQNFLMICAVVIVVFTVVSPAFSLSLNFSVWSLLAQMALFMVVDDVWFYIMHRLMHLNPVLFRHIHSVHHRVRTTLPLDFLYVHPLEWFLGSLGIAIAAAIIYLVAGSINAYAFFLYGFFRNIHEIDIHSSIPSKLSQHIPGFGTAEHHGDHHGKVKCNYASTFKWLDAVFKTRCD